MRIRLRSLVVAAAVVSAAARASAQFTATTPLPDGYNGHALIASGGFLYNAGGSSASRGFIDGANVFYSAVSGGSVGTWRATSSLPQPVIYGTGAAADGYVYVLGGDHCNDAFCDAVAISNVVYFAKANADGTLGAWAATSPLPEAVYFPSAAVWNGTIYVTGGFNGSDLTAGVYGAKVNADGSLGAWRAMTPLPQKLFTHAAVSNGFLYVLGGAINGGTQISNGVYFARINADGTLGGWTQTLSLPQPVSNTAGIYANGNIFVAGGWAGTAPTSAVVRAQTAADGSVGPWSSASPLLDAVYFHSAAVSGGYFFVSGGADNADSVRLVQSMPLPPPPPPPPPTDSLPPRTTLAIGTPKVAAAPPFVAPVTPMTLSAVDDGTTVGDGAGVGVRSTQWSVDSGAFATYSGAFSVAADGAHWIRYFSVDNLGHVETTQAAQVAVDGTAPASSLSVGAPQAVLASGELVVGPATPLAASAQDPVVNGAASGVASLSATLDGAPVSSPSSFTLPAADGPHTVVTSAVDNVGNAEAPRARVVYRDGTSPISSVSPDGAAILGAGAALSFSASDPASGGVASGVHHVEYALDAGPWTAVAAGLSLPEGAHALHYRAVDNVGNAEAAKSAAYRVDLTPPQTTLSVGSGLTLFGVDALTPDATLTLSARDPSVGGVASGVARIVYSVDGGPDQVYSGPFRLGLGAHIVSFGAVDNAGNAEERRAVSLSVSQFLSDAAAGLDSAAISGGASVTGDVRSNGAITVAGKSSIAGSATGQTVTIDGKATISGTVTRGQSTLPVGAYDLAAARAWAQAHNGNAALPAWALSGGALALSGSALTIPAGDYYLTGLSLSGDAAVSLAGRANIFVDGPISIDSQATLNASGDANSLWVVVGSGDVSLAGQQRSAFNLYAPASSVAMTGGGQYAGRQLGRTLALAGKAQQPSTTALPAPSHDPGAARHRVGAGSPAPAKGDGSVGGRSSPASSARVDSAAPESSGFSPAGAASFGAAPSGGEPAAGGSQAPQTLASRLPPLVVSSHHVVSLISGDGASVRAKDRSAVVIPPGAAASALAVSVGRAAAAEPLDQRRQKDSIAAHGLVAAGGAVQYGPEGARFTKPVTLEIPYDRLQLPAGVAENTLAIHYWNPSTGDWERLDSSVDSQSQVVRAQTSHFSLYQVFSGGGTQAAPAPGASLAFGQVYAFPNPARPGESPTIHVEAGSADHIDIHVYDLSGQLKDSASSDGARAAFEYRWDVGGVGSGVYIYVVTASQNGGGKIRRTGRLAVIK